MCVHLCARVYRCVHAHTLLALVGGARDAAIHTPMHGTAPPNKELSGSQCHSSQVEKPYLKGFLASESCL